MHFDLLPNDLILTFDTIYSQWNAYYVFWVLVDKSDTTLSFRVQVTHTFDVKTEWKFILSPVNPPRELIDYVLI